MQMDYLGALLLVALAVSAASVTITKSQITASFRAKLWQISLTKPKMKSIAYLFDCPYCMSHWIAFFLVFMSFAWTGVIEYLVMVGAVIAIAAIATGAIMMLMGWHQAEVDQMRKELDEAYAMLEKLSK